MAASEQTSQRVARAPRAEPPELDLRGEVCPDATVETVRAVKSMGHGESLDVISDYYPARHTIPALMEELGFACELLDDRRPVFRFRIHRTANKEQDRDV